MSFGTLLDLETIEQETSRLATTPRGSKLHDLAALPVLQENVDIADIYRLPAANDGSRVVGVVTGVRPSTRTVTNDGVRLRDLRYTLMVVGGTSEVYPVGSYDIIVTESELRRSEKITLD